MSKRGYISRYLLITKKVKSRPFITYQELQASLDKQFEYLQMRDEALNVGFSKRTLQRDLREIRHLFGINIEYSRRDKGYYISEDAGNNNFERMMEAFDIFNSLNMARDLAPYIHLEKQKPQGTEHLYGLLHAIKNRQSVHFTYQKFWEETATKRKISPYAMKEFKNRWYLLGRDEKDNNIKTFALDRLSNLHITDTTFSYPDNYRVGHDYQYCFGIISPNDGVPKEIILSYDPHQGKYIKTLPLHETQEVLIDNEEELRVKLKLFDTHDFLMELLSFGDNVKVLEPLSLAQEIKETHRNAFLQY